jgi:26S proteasome regulatory subunit N9
LGEKLIEATYSLYFKAEHRLIDTLNGMQSMGYKDRINSIVLARFVIAASAQHVDAKSALERVTKELGDLDNPARKKSSVQDEEAILLLKMHSGLLNVRLGELKLAKTIIDQAQEKLEGKMDPIIHAKFYETSMEYYKAKGVAALYFKNAILYLSYADLTHVDQATKFALVSDLSFAALLGEDVYNFGELVIFAFYVIKCLRFCIASTPNLAESS